MPTSFDISPLRNSCHRFALLLLLLGPLMVQALPIEEDAMAKGGRGGGGGGGRGRGNDKSFWSKTVNFGTLKIPIIVFIVICIVLVGILVAIFFILRCFFDCFKGCCGCIGSSYRSAHGWRARRKDMRDHKAHMKEVYSRNNREITTATPDAATGIDVERGEMTQNHPLPYNPYQQQQQNTTPVPPYTIPNFLVNQGEVKSYNNQPYGEGGLGYTGPNDKVPGSATPSIGYSSNPPTPRLYAHTYTPSQTQLLGSPPFPTAGQR